VSALSFVNLEQVYYRYILRQVDIQDYLLTRLCSLCIATEPDIEDETLFSLNVICITTYVNLNSVTYSVKSHRVQIMRN